jgi:hypothetical protein
MIAGPINPHANIQERGEGNIQSRKLNNLR